MGGNWVVQEGYLQFKFDGAGHSVSHAAHDAVAKVMHRPTLVERYFVLNMNRKMEIFETSSKEKRVDACYLRGFCGWDGDGLLKAGEAYGLELKLDKHAEGRMFVAAFNRLDLDKWCRAYVAVLDPESAAGQEVRRERRKVRKEEKRAQEEKEEKIRQWKEQQKKMIEDEKRRLQEREEEILNMTPLERIDGLGSLDDDTARMLEKRRQRLQRRQAPTTRRVNKAAFRQRLDDAAGGKLENVQPLQAKIVAEQRSKVRVEPPPPGQFIEIAGSARRSSNPVHRRRLDSTDGSGSDDSSGASRMSSGPFSSGSVSNGIPPPPPPPMSDFDDSRSDFIPPPPPIPSSRRTSRAHSVRGSLYDDDDRQSIASSRMSHSARRLSGVDRDKFSAQASLAAILGGRGAPSGRARQDSFESTADSTTNEDFQPTRSRGQKAEPQKAEPSMTNAFAASLAAIRRNRADTMDEGSVAASPPPRKRDRKRDTQLSAEGKALLQKAMAPEPPAASSKKGGRKGLFDESSSDDNDSDAGLFGVRKEDPASKRERSSDASSRAPAKPSRASVSHSNGRGSHVSDDSEDESVDNGMGFLQRSVPSDATSPRSMRSSVSANNAPASSRPKTVDVMYKSCVLETQGKKSVPVYTFAFRSGDAEQSFSRSYDEYDGIHDRLASDKSLRLPKFPSKHILRNNSKPENMQKRAMEFVQYFQQLVAVSNIFDNKRFLFEYQISDDFLQSMRGVNTRPPPSSGRPTPTASRTPKPTRTNGAGAEKSSNGGAYRSTALFGADDTDSDADSVAGPARTPQKPVPSSPVPEPKKKKKTKPSRTDFDDDFAASPSKARRDRARSRNSVASNMTDRNRDSNAGTASSKKSQPGEPPVPKITGLPARPNLFGGGRGDLLAAIRQGAALKKVDGEESAAAPAVAPAGRGAGIVPPAKSAAFPPPPPPPPLPAPITNAGSVAEAITNAMAARRIHVEYEEKSDSDSDDDWD